MTLTITDIEKMKNQINELYSYLNEAIIISKHSSEEKLKNEVISVFRDFFKSNGINFSDFIDYELSEVQGYRLKGRTDALYGTLIMEFKRYNILSNERELEKAKNQVKEKYLDNLGEAGKRAFAGVIFDGVKIVFIKYEIDHWNYSACTFNTFALYDWLILFIDLMKKPYSARLMELDFSSDSAIATEFISKMYSKLNSNFDNPRIKMLFNEWDKTFSYIYGGVLTERKIFLDFNSIAKTLYKIEEDIYVDRFLFIIYTYYSLIIKLIACEISSIHLNAPFVSPAKFLMQNTSLKEGLTYIEDGNFYKDILNIDNYIEGGFFSWYLECFDEDTEKVVINVLTKINEYNPDTLVDQNNSSKDLLRNLYQNVVPQKIRHDLGEYYTADWLVQFTTIETGFKGNIDERVLDAGCGSGSFLREFINKIRLTNSSLNKKDLLKAIIKNVIGFDVNPVAVLTARTNYLLSISDLLKDQSENLSIPVFLADSILTPTTEGVRKQHDNVYRISTVEGLFKLPKEFVDRGVLQESLRLAEDSLENGVLVSDFERILNTNIKDISKVASDIFIKFYLDLYKLHSINKNKIWSKIIQNSFAPLLFSEFDYVIGNPPWIKWEFLSQEYKEKLSNLYLKIYKLYSYKGMKAGMGFAHDDISIVFTYVCIDKYLKKNGRLGFVLKQTLYRGIASKEFRKFKIEKADGITPIKATVVHDLLDLKPFKGSNSETSVIVMVKGEDTTYPVPYIEWHVKDGESITEDLELSQVFQKTYPIPKYASPDSNTDDPTNPWIISEDITSERPTIIGTNHYEVHHGVVNDLNSVFIINILEDKDKYLLIENSNIGRKKVKSVKALVERDLIFPLLKPRHIKKWEIRGEPYDIILPHTKYGRNNETELMEEQPKTYHYLLTYKDELLGRKSRWFKGNDKPFYTLFGIGEYTFKPYKVVWSMIGYLPYFAVASSFNDGFIGDKILIPDNTIGYISFDDLDEAFYVCAILNSNFAKKIFSRKSTKSKWGISKELVESVPISAFHPKNKIHKELSELSKQAHIAKIEGTETAIIEDKLEKLVDSLFDQGS